MIRRVLVLMVALGLAACDDATATHGACYHEYREPILTLTSRDASRLHLSGIRIDGQAVPLEELISVASDAAEPPVVDGDGLLCQVPCSFGTQSGEWDFAVTAPDGRRTEVRRQVSYAEFGTGCPSFEDGGAVIEVALPR